MSQAISKAAGGVSSPTIGASPPPNSTIATIACSHDGANAPGPIPSVIQFDG